jgi:de-etiolated-1
LKALSLSLLQTLCKDFLLIAEGGALAICATSSPPDSHPPAAKGALPGVPSMELITLYLVRLSDGMIVDQKAFHNDYINLAHNSGVFLYDDLLAVLSVRFQCVHIFQVRCCCF